MPSSRNIVVAGAGIGGLTTALTLVRSGFRVTLLDRAERLEETGAGIQLSPNASRILIGLGLGPQLQRHVLTPAAVNIRTASGSQLTRMPLGEQAQQRYGAPYWSIHRGDLQAVLLEAVRANPNIALRLGTRIEDFAVHARGISVACHRGARPHDEHGVGLIGADGVWSVLRTRLGHQVSPTYAGRTAWRALVPTERVGPEFRGNEVHLWLGADAHLVHYPVKAGAMINIVAIVDDRWSEPGWNAAGSIEELLSHYSPRRWCKSARMLLQLPDRWLKWALCDLPPLRRWGDGPVTLIGDAAHPMLPFLAQGAAMAIEDAAVLADSLARQPDKLPSAMRDFERRRRRRTARVQRNARRNGRIYHLPAGEAWARNLFLRLFGGQTLLHRYDWLYDWHAPVAAGAIAIDTLPARHADEQ